MTNHEYYTALCWLRNVEKVPYISQADIDEAHAKWANEPKPYQNIKKYKYNGNRISTNKPDFSVVREYRGY